MNAEQRKKLNEAQRVLELQKGVIEGVKDENQDSFDNMPEGLQQGEKGEQFSNAIEALENCLSSLEEAVDHLTSIE